MARPREFDRNDVVDAAIRVFSRHGFGAASLTELLDEMGISRQSLYSAFGDKRGLFLEARGQYSFLSLVRLQDMMNHFDSSLEALEGALLLDLGYGADIETGCLDIGSIAEFGRSDPELNLLSERESISLVAAFAECARDGVASGELRSELDTDAVGRMLVTLKFGLKVAVRGGANEREVRNSVRLVLDGLAAK